MKRNSGNRWDWRIGAVALVLGGLLLAWYGIGNVAAAPPVNLAAGPPVKGDLSGVTQNWDKVLPVAERFIILTAFNNEAVRDNETGLVWEKAPDALQRTWLFATTTCANKSVGGRKGWRLPSFDELASLVDPSVPAGPLLPAGHPFDNVQSSVYWAAPTWAALATEAWVVNFHMGGVGTTLKSLDRFYWCARGAGHADTY